MPAIFNIGNVLSQSDTFATNTSKQILRNKYSAIVCVTPVIPQGTKISFDSNPQAETVYPFQLIQRNFQNKIEVKTPATLESTDVTISQNLALEWVLFFEDETPYIPTWIPKNREISWIVNTAAEKSLQNLAIKEANVTVSGSTNDESFILLPYADGFIEAQYFITCFEIFTDHTLRNTIKLNINSRLDFNRHVGSNSFRVAINFVS